MSLSSKLVLASALALAAAPTVAMADTQAPIVELQNSVQNDQAPKQAQDTSDYAQREAQDKKVQNYQGGSTVVIGISGGALLVLLFLLLIL
jgi:hypothetical protein